MYIHRIILRDVKSIEHLDITFYDDWRNEPLKSILLTGPNGSGKTTILKVIAALWENFGKWLQSQQRLPENEHGQNGFLLNAGLAAIEIRDLAPVPIRLYMAQDKSYYDEIAGSKLDSIIICGEIVQSPRDRGTQKAIGELRTWFDDFAFQQRRLMTVGSDVSIPNLLFIDAETRFKPLSTKKPSDFERFYEWFATYPSLTGSYGNLNKLLSNLKIRSPEAFYQFIKRANNFLGNKKHLIDFDGELRLRVELTDDSKKFHYIEDLSSGEQQCLLLIYLASRWLMPGGIMLIDEPDLHLHESLQRHFLRELQKVVVDEKQGQLIVTSHSPTLWKEYGEAQSFDLGEKVHG